jgi:DNA helicase HerA-like ATPase
MLLWLLSELFEQLPEVGDPEKPKLAFFFDEAHLLFNDSPKELLDRIEQVVRLVRSKGVGVWFVTQNPLDVPDTVLGQLGNRVQHALRAFTPRDQQAVKAAATTFRPNPKLDVEKAITELGVGEALVSFLDEKGRPQPVERALVIPPRSRIGPISPEERRRVIDSSLVAGHYEKAVDRESAYEILASRAGARAQGGEAESGGLGGMLGKLGFPGEATTKGRTRETAFEAAAKSAARAMGSEVGRRIIRGVLGSILGGRR